MSLIIEVLICEIDFLTANALQMHWGLKVFVSRDNIYVCEFSFSLEDREQASVPGINCYRLGSLGAHSCNFVNFHSFVVVVTSRQC